MNVIQKDKVKIEDKNMIILIDNEKEEEKV